MLALVVLAVGLWWLFRQMRFTSVLRATSVTASAMLLILLVVSGAALSSLGESFGFEMTEAIEQELGHDLDRTRMTLIGEPAHAARIRICSGGRLKVDHRYARDLETAPATPLVAALNRDDLLEIPAAKLLAVPCGLDKLNAAEAWDAFQAGHWTEYLEAHRRRYYVAIRANADSSLPPRVAGDLSTSGQLR
ncbi:MAG: hypothetical protein KDA75_04965 [Planctomycetaceae bacterium]|nr:hypothetical protein [Planctomycetaceae bacterium]